MWSKLTFGSCVGGNFSAGFVDAHVQMRKGVVESGFGIRQFRFFALCSDA